jgi:hypothetical protein
MRHGSDRIRNRRRAVRVSRRAERRLTSESRVDLPAPPSAERPVVVNREFHEEVVLLLTVMDGVSITDFPHCEKAQ